MKPSDYNLNLNLKSKLNNTTTGEVIGRKACPSCRAKGKDRKGDNLVMYKNEDNSISYYCFGCGHSERPNSKGHLMEQEILNTNTTEESKVNKVLNFSVLEDEYNPKDIKSFRGITANTYEKFGVQTNDGKQVYPFFTTTSQKLCGIKTRIIETKQFFPKGSFTGGQVGLFGSQLFPKGSAKEILITEGEIDAISAYQLLNERVPCISVNNGAAGAKRNIGDNFDYIASFPTIYICFDNDTDGREAADKVADMFPPGQVRIISFPEGYKDANDVLQKSEEPNKLFHQLYRGATIWTPDGIICSANIWDTLTKEDNTTSVPYPWESLNKMTYGIRGGELITLTAGSGSGKSLVMREIAYHLLMTTKENVGLLFLEESLKRTAQGLISVHLSKPIHLPDTETSAKELKGAYTTLFSDGRVYFFDHFGSTSIDNIVARVRYMAKVANCKYIFLDHLSIIVSGQDNGDERKAIDEIVTKLRTLVQETGVALFMVSHLKRVDDNHEEGGAVSLSHLRGSQSIAQLSDFVVSIERNQQDPSPIKRNTVGIRILKNRYVGETGICTALRFNRETFRFSEVPIEELLNTPDEESSQGFKPITS